MAHEAPKGTPNFNTRLVFVIGLCTALLFVTTLLAIWAGFEFVWNAEVYEKQYRPAYPELVKIQQEQRELIEDEGAAMTIDAAMRRVVEQGGS